MSPRAERALWMAGLLMVVGAALVAATACLTSGCSSLGYYAQSVDGHLKLLNAARPVPDWVADPQTPDALRQRLELSQQMRNFAVNELALPDNASYRRYAELHRNAAVWNVVAAPELGLTLKTWCFPVVGCVGYRGYFDRAEAEALALQLRAEGLEVNVYGVPAYSTLGRLPGAPGYVTETFCRQARYFSEDNGALIDAIRAGWVANDMKPKTYGSGTWGPSAAIALTERDGVTWQDD